MTYELPTTQYGPREQTSPEKWATQVQEITTALIKEGLDEYKQVRLFRVPPVPPVKLVLVDAYPCVQDPAGIIGHTFTFTLEKICNYYSLAPTDTEEEFHEEFLSKAVKVASEISTIVNFLIREQAKKFGFDYKRELDRVSAIDIFSTQEGTPNLKINVVKNVSTLDPDGVIMGWIAYKFFFACGY